MSKFHFRHITIHVLVWLLYIFYELSILILLSTSPVLIYETFIWFIINIGLFYACSELIFPALWSKKNAFYFIGSILLSIGAFIVLSLGISMYLLPFLTGSQILKFTIVFNKVFIVQRVWRAGWFIGLGGAYWLSKRLISIEKNNNLLLRQYYDQKMQEKELKRIIVATELAYEIADKSPLSF